MGEIDQKSEKLEKKYKEIYNFHDLLSEVDEFEKKLKHIRENRKLFDEELKIEKGKEQRRISRFL